MADFLVSPDGMTPTVGEDLPNSTEATPVAKDGLDVESQWGFSLPELYKLSLTFFKDKEGKAFHLSYRDKVQLIAYVKQITCGKYDPTNSPPVGYLDVVGNDRRRKWQELGDMTKETAMLEFCLHLNETCTQLKPYIEAHRREKEEQERRRKEEEEKRRRQEEEERERQRLEEEERRRAEEEFQRQEQERLQFKEAIYKQLLPQFVCYACFLSHQQQQVLLQQLQEHYYQQYLQQLEQQHRRMEQQGDSLVTGSSGEVSNASTTGDLEQGLTNLQLSNQAQAPNGDVNRGEDELPDRHSLPEIAKPNCWTTDDSQEFKEKLAKDSEGMIRVGHGETVTVRVPTHEEGNCIFWEFATDYCDIGFGLYFEWTVAPSNAISVHVSDSSEEDELDEDEDGKTDPERGTKESGPPIDEIIPIYRRDSHQKKFCGSHRYPGRGVYLLKFDNSYSLFRAKSLYYKVYYTRDDR
ncbi:Golgi resident protein GCP60-like [Acanthaster planci]|uniref:Golgi resident protein GCP60-like n=1 Tax=Acanthaster planci TaxID=133434 RepID=A0A8B7YBP3_ACAPL|nr:Golgi resident protein GCP60-like [Acanthaster planci]